jgi:predicted XRE-type DNA-binding protein
LRRRLMDSKTRRNLEAAGWKTGDARDFLDLTDAEAEFIEMKLALAQDLRARRLARHLNQTQVARIVGSSQSRVAKMEAADPSVSIDLLVKALLRLGAERKELAKTLSRGPQKAAS